MNGPAADLGPGRHQWMRGFLVGVSIAINKRARLPPRLEERVRVHRGRIIDRGGATGPGSLTHTGRSREFNLQRPFYWSQFYRRKTWRVLPQGNTHVPN